MSSSNSKPTRVEFLIILTVVGGLLDILGAALLLVLTSVSLSWFGVEFSTVGALKRIQRLKEQGVIKHFTIKTDPEKLGLTTPILILIRLHSKTIKEFVKDIQCPELQERLKLTPPIADSAMTNLPNRKLSVSRRVPTAVP